MTEPAGASENANDPDRAVIVGPAPAADATPAPARGVVRTGVCGGAAAMAAAVTTPSPRDVDRLGVAGAGVLIPAGQGAQQK